MKCNTVEDVVNMGISIFVKARVFLNEVMTWKINGVPMEYFSVDQGTIRENNDAEDRIDEVKVDNHEDRKTNDDDVDSEIMYLLLLHMLFYYIVLHTCRYVFIH